MIGFRIRWPVFELLGFWSTTEDAAPSEKVRHQTVLSYWSALFDGVQYSPQEFYRQVEERLRAREVPDLIVDRPTMRESHRFSARRLYLRLKRQRLAFEICAAPFGNGFFVSERFFDRRKEVRWYHYLLALFLLSQVGLMGFHVGDEFLALILIGFVVTGLWSVMRLAITYDPQLDDTLANIPLLGRFYEAFFHPDTFFKHDQNEMYRKAVHRAVLESSDAMTQQKGIRALSEEERKPILPALNPRR